jgi:hypothetical protein
VPAAGLVLPADGPYDVVFDTRSAAAAGPFTFRYWVNDVTPPRLRVVSTRGRIDVAASDAGSGVDFASLTANVDGKPATARVARGVIRIPATKGRHKVVVTVGDYQETRNMEDVGPVLPNTGRLGATVTVR